MRVCAREVVMYTFFLLFLTERNEFIYIYHIHVTVMIIIIYIDLFPPIVILVHYSRVYHYRPLTKPIKEHSKHTLSDDPLVSEPKKKLKGNYNPGHATVNLYILYIINVYYK